MSINVCNFTAVSQSEWQLMTFSDLLRTMRPTCSQERISHGVHDPHVLQCITANAYIVTCLHVPVRHTLVVTD